MVNYFWEDFFSGSFRYIAYEWNIIKQLKSHNSNMAPYQKPNRNNSFERKNKNDDLKYGIDQRGKSFVIIFEM